MGPVLKLLGARLVLFVAVAAVLSVLPIELDPFVKLLIALVVSMVVSAFVLRGLRRDVGARLERGAQQRLDRERDAQPAKRAPRQ
ncbi:DUF4229 domain-containing protein [Dactylosporangium cerinum]|uniref:DUF4229 domain-containing protein n=1 Tax=Dactylosporangium cerinum TaxID=1434730 RepID=A0ABV9VWZ5_9ACTN